MRHCPRCKASFIDDGNSMCPRCDAETTDARTPGQGVYQRVLTFRLEEQKKAAHELAAAGEPVHIEFQTGIPDRAGGTVKVWRIGSGASALVRVQAGDDSQEFYDHTPAQAIAVAIAILQAAELSDLTIA